MGGHNVSEWIMEFEIFFIRGAQSHEREGEGLTVMKAFPYIWYKQSLPMIFNTFGSVRVKLLGL